MNRITLNVKRRLAASSNYALLLGIIWFLEQAEVEATDYLNKGVSQSRGLKKAQDFLSLNTAAIRASWRVDPDDFHKFSYGEGIKIKTECLATILDLHKEFMGDLDRFLQETGLPKDEVYTGQLVINQIKYLRYYFTAHFTGKVKRQPPLCALRSSRKLVDARKLIPPKASKIQVEVGNRAQV